MGTIIHLRHALQKSRIILFRPDPEETSNYIPGQNAGGKYRTLCRYYFHIPGLVNKKKEGHNLGMRHFYNVCSEPELNGSGTVKKIHLRYSLNSFLRTLRTLLICTSTVFGEILRNSAISW